MKKINFKQPKYILPLIVLLPLVFLVYNISNIFSGNGTEEANVVHDSINMALPEADEQSLESKLDAMNRAEWNDDALSALYGIGQDEEERDTSSQGYSDAELQALARDEAERARQAQQQAELERTLSESRRHLNNYTSPNSTSGYTSPTRSQYDQLEDYSQALEQIQSRNSRLNKSNNDYAYDDEPEYTPPSPSTTYSSTQPPVAKEKPALVQKTSSNGIDRFNTIGRPHTAPDAALIKAIIDQTTKARNGTRLRFKLLDDVTIKGVTIKKGAYFYGTVTGFSEQRVLASITSILINDQFVPVNLSVYDTDGMQGFYVPASTFRSFLKESGANLANSGSSVFNSGGNTSSAVSAEMMALQALQGVYSSASSAISNNLRQDKAKIKYNTTVYLINQENQ